ncbi:MULTISPECIES: hypothetical protein [Lysinibacillus]|uniref:hypothetical protein n=1 Tax=Lysinibacillus TaxID=400634 RepID=UPI00201B3BF2|nr:MULTISPECIES: hypothetical protein [unclassified Lysinibacillus]MEE3806082.1 hypothetical protein [Lysinibacillus fusiformis]
MCEYHSKFNGLLSELNNQRGLLTKELSRLDKYISSMYHDLEGIDPTEEFSLSFVTQLQDTLKKRRVVKDEMARLDAVLNPLRNVAGDIETSVNIRKKVSKRWKRDFKMTLTIEEVISASN